MKISLRSAFIIAATGAVLSPASLADSGAIVGELKSCARIVASDARISCYESLGRRVIRHETSASPNPDPVASTTAAEAAVVAGTVSDTTSAAVAPSEQSGMNDTMGGYQYAEKPSDHPDNDINTRVVLCQQDIDKAWYFKFENGQVWKQVDRTTRHFKDCDFPVVVTKDGFGYKMQVEGKGAKIRISRRR